MIVKQGNRFLIEGPIRLENVGTLLAEGAAFEGDRVIVDLSGVTGADSSALSLLLEWVRRSSSSGGQISFANLSPNLISMADLYGIAELIPSATD